MAQPQTLASLIHAQLHKEVLSQRYKFPFSEQDTMESLTVCYRYEMEKVGNDPNDITKQTLEKIKAASQWLVSGVKSGLLLYGFIGNGKTTLMNAIATLLRSTNQRVPVTYSAVEIANISKDREKFDELKNRGFLCIDELGTEPDVVKSYGNEINPIVELLNHRYNNRAKLLTVITTNLNMDDIEAKYSARISSRFDEQYNFIAFVNESYRK